MTIRISTKNSSTTPLDSGETFVGISEDVNDFGTIRIALRSESGVSGTLYVCFSSDESLWSETSYSVSDPSTYEPLVVKVSQRYFRVRYTNGGVDQTAFRIQSELNSGEFIGGGGGGGGGGGTANQVRQIVTLSSGNIASKSFTIASAPANPANLDFIPYSGPKQRYSVDFTVSGNTVSWSGLGLDGTLAVNDVIEITYFT